MYLSQRPSFVRTAMMTERRAARSETGRIPDALSPPTHKRRGGRSYFPMPKKKKKRGLFLAFLHYIFYLLFYLRGSRLSEEEYLSLFIMPTLCIARIKITSPTTATAIIMPATTYNIFYGRGIVRPRTELCHANLPCHGNNTERTENTARRDYKLFTVFFLVIMIILFAICYYLVKT